MKKSVIYLQVFARIVSPLITLIVTILSLLPSRSLSQTLTFSHLVIKYFILLRMLLFLLRFVSL